MDSRDPSSLERKALNVPCRPARLAWKTRQSAPNSCVLCHVVAKFYPHSLRIIICAFLIYWFVSRRYLHRCSSAKTPSGYPELNRKSILYTPGFNHLVTPHSEKYGKQKTNIWFLFLRLSNIRNVLTQSIQSDRLSELGITTTTSPASKYCSPLESKGGGDTLACGVGGGWPNSDEGTNTLILYVLYTAL